MYRSPLFLTAILLGTNMALVQQVAIAKSAVEVGTIATAITVEIKSSNDGKTGSGILLQQQEDVYTILTAAHVVLGGDAVTIKTSDGKIYRSFQSGNSISLPPARFSLLNSCAVHQPPNVS
jgi:hypothetical protein